MGGFSFLFLCPGQDGRATAIDLAVTKQPMPSSRKFTSRRPYLTAHPPKMEGIVQPPPPSYRSDGALSSSCSHPFDDRLPSQLRSE